jgi:TonB family protein
LQHDIPLPNIVAWSGKPQLPIAPVPAVPVSEITRLAPRMESDVIAPPPVARDNLRDDAGVNSRHALPAAVIAPPPAVEDASTRRLGDLNVGRSSVIAPAPQLTLDAQRAPSGRSAAGLRGQAQVVAPPPSLRASGNSRSGASVVALSLHPAVGAPPTPPEGNRRGSFAAGPEGHRGASGKAGANSGNGKADASGSSKKSSSNLPSGLYVGPTANSTSTVAGDPIPKNTVNPNLLAGVRPPRVSSRALQTESDSKLSTEERTVFGNRKFYSLSLNMPNLNSAGGSWIIRFAALKPDSSSSPGARAAASTDPASVPLSDLSAPVATRKVDPAYPLELMKQNVRGTVILYGIIHADGTVGSVRVLRSVDDRLDHFASEAIAKWQFHPATKNGDPVDVEATFWIPFRPSKF